MTTALKNEEKTTEYSVFSFKNDNRTLSKKQINKLKNAILDNGYKEYLPILVNEDFEVLDGQHRFITCKELGLPICYRIISEDDETQAILDMNSLSKNWTIKDYVHCYAQRGNSHYIRLENLSKELDVPILSCLNFLPDYYSGGALTAKVREGKITFTLDDSLRVRGFYANLNKVLNATRMKKSARFAEALLTLSKDKNFKWGTMIEKATKYPTIAYPCRTVDEFCTMLKNLYNYNTRKQELRID